MSKAILWVLVTVFALLVGVFALLFLANWNDDPLSETSRRALTYVPPTGNQIQGNGHILLMALDASAPDKSRSDAVEPARQLGLQRLQREQERFQWNARFGSVNHAVNGANPPKPVDGSNPLKAEQLLAPELRCTAEQTDCLAWAVQHRKPIMATDPARRAVLARLSAASNAPQYANVFPNYQAQLQVPLGLLLRGTELQLLQASVLWNDKAYEKALDQVEQIERLRQRMASSNNLIVSTAAASTIRHALLKWSSNVITRDGKRLRPQDAERLQKLLATPQPSLRNGLQAEMVSSASTLHSIGTQLKQPLEAMAEVPATEDAQPTPHIAPALGQFRRFFNKLLYLPNATTNADTERWQLTIPLADAAPAQIDEAHADAKAKRKALRESRKHWLGARNIVGNQLLDIGDEDDDPGYAHYIRRNIDVDGYRRLVLLQLQATLQNKTPSDVAQWLASSADDVRNPYDRKPMQWDAASSSLMFEGREKQAHNPAGSNVYRVRL